jgi:predicted RNA methylase
MGITLGGEKTTASRPEERVRQQAIKELKEIGWKDSRLRWKPEWPVPDTPHDLTKRERGQKYATCGSADLVAFADESGEPHALQIIFEFKEPTIEKGRMQLIRYLSNEPVARMGFWTNGTKTLAVYKSHTNDWIYVEDAPLPAPGDDLTRPPERTPTWNDLREPNDAELTAALRRIVATAVVSDSRATRREDQLRELLHTVLVKVDADAWASKSANRDKPHPFRIYGDKLTMVEQTADAIRAQFKAYFTKQRNRVFHPDDRDELYLTDETIFAVVDALGPWRILGDSVDVLAKAFQVFRTKSLKSGEGQFLTPQRVIRPSVKVMEITSQDKVIDPACGTGGFVIEALRQVQEREFPDDDRDLLKFANDNLYAVDIDPIGTKLTRAMMIAARDGSTHVLMGDAVRVHQWDDKFPRLAFELGDGHGGIAESFTVVITNPPFGEDLKVKAADARAGGYTIAKAAASGKREYVDLEIGLLYLELSHKLLQTGGRVGIVLPETYFFSHKYRWLSGWLEGRFELRGMFNIAMEAFEEFCRAKTNFYVLEKVGDGPEEMAQAETGADTPKED